MFIQQPFDQFLDLEYERINESRVKVNLPIKPLYINSLGVVHGGIISTLADVAMCNTIEPDEENQQKVVTVDLNVTFLKGAREQKHLIAFADLIKRGRTLSHAECLIYDEADNLIAKAKTTLFNN
ncbi:PaaI family thioesterase [Alkalihalobacillus sp. AL-G]|uniref:PaaI family thioesterase n=1 Tax=Alkalihalobacillus sp. AL-G TaxID=2926399 RepID=UPI00272A7B7D|nr:PaaI family thioesterase [Alkalihalobacillus sp. AL-G]WLD92573.1 PaaI family thioesterase [Alkalihalobacillus sp. AL-G]